MTPGNQPPIREDVPCVSCGYNLRGLHAEGNCPECGTEIYRSLRGDALRFRHPRWVGRLRTGAGLAYHSWLVMWAPMVVPMPLLFLADPPDWAMSSSWIEAAIFAAGVGGFLVGLWLLTTPEPSGGSHRGERCLRLISRYGLPGPALAFILTQPGPLFHPAVQAASEHVGGWLISTWLICVFLHVGRLANRLPSRGIRVVSYICSCCMLVTYVASWRPTYVGSLGHLALNTVLIAFLVTVVCVSILLRGCFTGVREAARQAKRDWPLPSNPVETADDSA